MNEILHNLSTRNGNAQPKKHQDADTLGNFSPFLNIKFNALFLLEPILA